MESTITRWIPAICDLARVYGELNSAYPRQRSLLAFIWGARSQDQSRLGLHCFGKYKADMGFPKCIRVLIGLLGVHLVVHRGAPER